MNKVTWLLCTHAFWQKGDWEWVVSTPTRPRGLFPVLQGTRQLHATPRVWSSVEPQISLHLGHPTRTPSVSRKQRHPTAVTPLQNTELLCLFLFLLQCFKVLTGPTAVFSVFRRFTPAKHFSSDPFRLSRRSLHQHTELPIKILPTQKRNARETLRQIGILLIFFEEIQDRRSVLPDSVVLCFSELHLAFQKIQFLLEDCSREGARLWILMKSQFVATQFRVLIRAFATALEVLPLNCIDLTSEVKELVELVAKQARKARFDLDANDECAAKDVIWILNQFEKRIEPDMSVVKRVLDHLEIRSWSECNKEIRFMEELSLECDEREVTLLKSLMGLMSYCRGVMFEEIESSGTDQTEGRCSVEMLSCLNPEDFRCPISLELMTDPVTVSTGQTYDRSSIQKWLRAGNIICPKTGEKLINKELVPNSALRKLIQQFCEDHGVSLAKTETQNSNAARTIAVNSPAAAEATRFLSKFLARRLVSGTGEQKNKAAYEIRLLAKSSVSNRCCLIEAGTVPPLLNLLSSTDAPTQENAIAALLKFSKHSKGKKVIMDSGGLKLILKVLKVGPRLESRQIAAATLFYLASVDKYRSLIGETPEAIPSLVELIKTGTTIGKMHAVVAIFGLLLCGRIAQSARSWNRSIAGSSFSFFSEGRSGNRVISSSGKTFRAYRRITGDPKGLGLTSNYKNSAIFSIPNRKRVLCLNFAVSLHQWQHRSDS
ncbi:U-box domain-containing protein 19 [Vitis vinifera]|uniref:RING-type E3 ubiquitin transferase n=1 Tax=Vitis vinifera TaxID=29760 RepID=A0A438KAI7_VITVI|nr:U-box domain-containing protein 19 [Vitis vinifera]